MNPRFPKCLSGALFLALLVPLVACAETVTIPGLDGDKIELEIHRPADFQADKAYSILVGPGNYYWQDRPSQPGWIVVMSDAFYEDKRVARSKVVLAWLREQFQVKHGGFHTAGWSRNSAGVFEIVMAHPQEFLSVTGIAGMPGQSTTETQLASLKAIRVQFVVGENDSYWRSGSERWHEQMLALGIRSSLEIIPNGAHVMPEIANEPIFERLNKIVAEIGAGKPPGVKTPG
jgi:hypothetical protein